MKETSCQFGERRQLAGVITEPSGGTSRGALILINAGLVAKSGPFRLYVQIARRLARQGFLTLRFDLGGIGASRASTSGLPLRTRTEIEIRAAVDHLYETRGPSRVYLGGLCSGAEDSLRYAEADGRVSGVVMIDPFAYRTPGWRARHLLFQLTRRSLRSLGLYQPTTPPAKRLVSYEYMGREESTRIVSTLLARKAQLHFVYTGGSREMFNHEGQLAKMFPTLDLGPRVTVDHLPHMDHTQLLEQDRRQLSESICERLVAHST